MSGDLNALKFEHGVPKVARIKQQKACSRRGVPQLGEDMLCISNWPLWAGQTFGLVEEWSLESEEHLIRALRF